MKTKRLIEIVEGSDKVNVYEGLFDVLCFKKLKGKYSGKELDRLLKFIYYVGDDNSIYSDYPSSLREGAVKVDFLNDKDFVVNDVVKECIDKYRELNDTPLKRIIRGLNEKMDQVSEEINSVRLTIETAKGFEGLLKLLPVLLSNAKELDRKFNQEETKVKGSGSSDLGMFEI